MTSTQPPETDAERRARHLETLREMAELGRVMARTAAQKAAADPEAADAHALTFARVSRAVRQAIALEARVASGTAGATPRARAPRAPDARRAPLRQALHAATEKDPDRAALRREIDERLEHELAADPDADPAVILVAVANDLGLTLDASKLSDGLLGIAPNKPTQPNGAGSPYHPRDD